MCEDKLQYAIEQEIAVESWLDSELTVSDVVSVDRGETDVAAFDVTGKATVALSSGREIRVDWECFTQTVDGKTYAAIQSVG